MPARDTLGPQWRFDADKEYHAEMRMKEEYYGELRSRTSMVPVSPDRTSPKGMVPVNPEVPSAPPKGFDSSYAGETWDDGANDYEVF